jgi:hypothetical protein
MKALSQDIASPAETLTWNLQDKQECCQQTAVPRAWSWPALNTHFSHSCKQHCGLLIYSIAMCLYNSTV